MKNIKKIIFGAAAVAAIFCLASCKEPEPSEVAVYEYEYSDGDYSYTGTIVFLSDNTFSSHLSMTFKENTLSLIVSSGTYEGDPASDGEITLKITKMIDSESLWNDPNFSDPTKWKDIKQPELKELPADEQQEMTMTVSGGGKKLSNEYTEFTRK